MTLKDYLAQPGRTATALANELGVSVSTITRAADGAVPNKELVLAIMDKTGGAVMPNDFYGVQAA